MCYIPHMRCSPLCVFFRMCDLPLCAIFRYALSSAMRHPPLCAVFRYVLFPTRLPELAPLCVERLHVTINVVHACFFLQRWPRTCAHHTFCTFTRPLCAPYFLCTHVRAQNSLCILRSRICTTLVVHKRACRGGCARTCTTLIVHIRDLYAHGV